MEHREELNMELITEAEGVPELPEGLVSSGYMSGTSPPNSIYEQMDQEFQTPLIPYNATSLRSDLDFSGAAVYESMPAVESTSHVTEEQQLHPEQIYEPRFNIYLKPQLHFHTQGPAHRQYLFDINLTQKSAQRSVQVCRTCFQQIITTINLPCMCWANCLKCAPEMKKCSACGQTILQYVHF